MCTGKSKTLQGCFGVSEVYPRVYGEIISYDDDAVARRGLPPCVRGNLSGHLTLSSLSRSTPVCTGKSSIGSQGISMTRVYPRVYGEIFKAANVSI